MPKISVIIPIFNVEKYIERCARSLFEQTLDDMEFIFVDDCTLDNSLSILQDVIKDYPNRMKQIKIVHHEVNKGLTNARNTGLLQANGDFIAHVDSDDWVDVNMYFELYEKAIRTKSDVVYCDFIMSYVDNSKYYNTVDLLLDKKEFLKKYMVSGWTSVWNIIAKRSLYLKYNILSPISFTYCEDFHLSVRLMFYAEKIEKVEKPLYFYNRANVSSMLANVNPKAANDERICYLDLISFFENKGCLVDYKQELSWKILRTEQEWVLNVEDHHHFINENNFIHQYIKSCPFLNRKMKIMMWALVHHLGFVTRSYLHLRSFMR